MRLTNESILDESTFKFLRFGGCVSLKRSPQFQICPWRVAIKKEAKGDGKLETIKSGFIKKQMVLGRLFTQLVLTAATLNTPTVVYSLLLALP